MNDRDGLALDILRFLGALVAAVEIVFLTVRWFDAGGFWYFR